MTSYFGSQPVEPLALAPGDKLKFTEDRFWWTVQAVSTHFVALVRQATFQPTGEVFYTVIDWRNGVRGPCNLIGQGYGDGTYSVAECEEMLQGFEYDYQTDPNFLEAQRAYAAGEVDRASWPSPEIPDLEVSHRNWLPVNIEKTRCL